MTDALGRARRIALFGATSDIGLAVVRRLAGPKGAHVVLAGRPGSGRDAAVSSLEAAGHTVRAVDFDAMDLGEHPKVVAEVFADGDVDTAVIAFGVLGDQEQLWQDHRAAVDAATINYTATVGIGVELGRHLAKQGKGWIVALSSVAGLRARRSNFVYGSTKAGIDAFFTGLREALRPSGVRVLLVRPGFVQSKMTAGLSRAPLSVTPDKVAELTVGAVARRAEVVYTPGAMRLVMWVLIHMPAVVFRRLPV